MPTPCIRQILLIPSLEVGQEEGEEEEKEEAEREEEEEEEEEEEKCHFHASFNLNPSHKTQFSD